MSFRYLYPLEAFAVIAGISWWRTSDFKISDRSSEEFKKAYAADKKDKSRYESHLEIFNQALEAHFKSLLDDGILQPVTGLENRSISFINFWNGYIDGTNDKYENARLINEIRPILTRTVVEIDASRSSRKRESGYIPGRHTLPTEDQVKAAWEKMCSALDQGESNLGYGWEAETGDAITGERIKIIFERWVPRFFIYNDKYELEEIQDIAPLELVTAKFNVPSGKLMLTDALRVKGFKEAENFGEREYREMDLNSAKGRTARISVHAKEHEIAYTQTGNTSVAIYQDAAGRLMITERWFDEDWPEDNKGQCIVEGWEYLGDFSCDVWRILAFDRETAISQMTKGGNANAVTELNAYLAMAGTKVEPDDHAGHHASCYAANIVHLDVEPGQWEIYAGENFNDKVDRKAFDIPDGVEVWCILQKTT